MYKRHYQHRDNFRTSSKYIKLYESNIQNTYFIYYSCACTTAVKPVTDTANTGVKYINNRQQTKTEIVRIHMQKHNNNTRSNIFVVVNKNVKCGTPVDEMVNAPPSDMCPGRKTVNIYLLSCRFTVKFVKTLVFLELSEVRNIFPKAFLPHIFSFCVLQILQKVHQQAQSNFHRRRDTHIFSLTY